MEVSQSSEIMHNLNICSRFPHKALIYVLRKPGNSPRKYLWIWKYFLLCRYRPLAMCQLHIHMLLPYKPSIYNFPLSARIIEFDLEDVNGMVLNSGMRVHTHLVG